MSLKKEKERLVMKRYIIVCLGLLLALAMSQPDTALAETIFSGDVHLD